MLCSRFSLLWRDLTRSEELKGVQGMSGGCMGVSLLRSMGLTKRKRDMEPTWTAMYCNPYDGDAAGGALNFSTKPYKAPTSS